MTAQVIFLSLASLSCFPSKSSITPGMALLFTALKQP